MATITGLTMSIVQTYAPTGNTCVVNYSYTLNCNAEEEALGLALSFSVAAELWGKDGSLFTGADDALGTPPYDAHTINCGSTMPITRSFTLANCALLNEDLGRDEIYLKLKVTPSSGTPSVPAITTIEADSPVVTGYF